MITPISTSGHTIYGLKEFILDEEADVENLPVDCVQGSSAFVIATGNAYMINSQHEWINISGSTTGIE